MDVPMYSAGDVSPSVADVAGMLVAASAVEVTTDRGELVELWTIACEGAVVSASGPRLSVGEGMRITCRLASGGVRWVCLW